jgi:hypothetical protein
LRQRPRIVGAEQGVQLTAGAGEFTDTWAPQSCTAGTVYNDALSSIAARPPDPQTFSWSCRPGGLEAGAERL